MIRFIGIGAQICEGDDAFAFYDTITDDFVELAGEVVFANVNDFENCTGSSIKPMQLVRLVNLMPDDIRKKYLAHIENIKNEL